MTDKTSDPFGYIRALHFQGVEERIAKGQYVSAEQLADLVRTRGDVPVPDGVIDYMCQHLAGEIKKPRGRPAMSDIEDKRRKMFVKHEYPRLLGVLQKGELSPEDLELYGEEEESALKATPSERAARLVAKVFLSGPESWKQVRNIAASKK